MTRPFSAPLPPCRPFQRGSLERTDSGRSTGAAGTGLHAPFGTFAPMARMARSGGQRSFNQLWRAEPHYRWTSTFSIVDLPQGASLIPDLFVATWEKRDIRVSDRHSAAAPLPA